MFILVCFLVFFILAFPLVDASVSTLGSPCREVEASTWTDVVLSFTSVGRILPMDKS